MLARMTATKYMFNTADEGERDRLLAHAQMWDPVTRRRLGDIGVTDGWRCLEVGAGSGTMTRWLADRVGATGRVVATDIETRWLRPIEARNVEVLRHDVTTDPLGESVYDVICVRLVMTHLPDPQGVVDKMFRALVPGGWLLLEDYDLSTLPICHPPDATWQKVAAAPAAMIRMGGSDPDMGAKLTGMLHTVGAADVDTEAVALPRRMPDAQGLRAQFVQLRDRLVAAEMASAAEVDEVIAGFDDETCERVVHGPMMVTARGRRP